MQTFTLDSVETRDRVELLDQAAQSASVPFRASAAHLARPISFHHRDRYFGRVNVTETTFDNFRGRRSARSARADIEPRLVLTFSHGEYVVEQLGRLDRQANPSFVAWWSLAPVRLRTASPVMAYSVTVPLAELGLPHLFLRDVLVRDLMGSPLAPIVSRHVVELARLPRLDDARAATLAPPTTDLVRALLATAGGDEALSRQPLGRTLATQILTHLRMHATDPQLDADALAAHFGISRRYLYAVLASVDISLGDWLRSERLDRAARDLTNPANALASIESIARRSGFADHSTFSRAFRRRFGQTPSEWRSQPGAESLVPRPRGGR